LSSIIAGIDQDNQIRIEITIHGLYKSQNYGAILDSGFTAGLSIPLVLAVDLGLSRIGTTTVTLADGTTTVLPLFTTKVQVGDTTIDTPTIVMGSDILIGMELMQNFRVCVNAKDGNVSVVEQSELEKVKRLSETLRRIL